MSGGNLTEYLGKSVAVLVFGSNDYINNYLMPSIYSSSYYYNPPDFANLLLNHYTRQLLVIEISDNRLLFFFFGSEETHLLKTVFCGSK